VAEEATISGGFASMVEGETRDTIRRPTSKSKRTWSCHFI